MEKLLVALANAVWAADFLAQQQAMEDDGYVDRLEQARKVLEEYTASPRPILNEPVDLSNREKAMLDIGDQMAELLRMLIVYPMLPIQEAARLPEVIDQWRTVKGGG